MRDKAIVATLFLSGLRVSEAGQLKLSQVRERPEKFSLFNVLTVKNGDDREIEIPKDGILGELTVYFDKCYRHLTQTTNGLFSVSFS